MQNLKKPITSTKFCVIQVPAYYNVNKSLGPPRLITYSILTQADFCSGHGRILRWLFVGEWRHTDAEALGEEALHIKTAGTTLLTPPFSVSMSFRWWSKTTRDNEGA